MVGYSAVKPANAYVITLCPSKELTQRSHVLWLSRPDPVDPARRAKVLEKKVGLAVAYGHRRISGRRLSSPWWREATTGKLVCVRMLAQLGEWLKYPKQGGPAMRVTVCFSCKVYEKLPRLGWASGLSTWNKFLHINGALVLINSNTHIFILLISIMDTKIHFASRNHFYLHTKVTFCSVN